MSGFVIFMGFYLGSAKGFYLFASVISVSIRQQRHMASIIPTIPLSLLLS